MSSYHIITQMSHRPNEYSVVSLEDDFVRMAISHSWYKHLSLDGAWFDMYLEHGYYKPYSLSSPQDEGNLHWSFCQNTLGIAPLNSYRVKLNYCLIYANVILHAHDPNYNLLDWPWCLFDNPNQIQKINERIRDNYPHLSPVEIMDDKEHVYPPAITKPILAFLKEEYEAMFFQVIDVANRYYAENLIPETSLA